MNKLTKADCGERTNLETLKHHLLDMLISLDAFCRENNIRYYLSGGTLLGAVRHKGFIPWDDDIDVNMPRPDCERLQKLSGGKIGSYILVPPNADSAYPSNFWRIYDFSIIIESNMGGTSSKLVYQPAFLDIFPIEGLPATEKETIAHFRAMYFSKKMLNCMNGSLFHGKTLPARIFHFVGRPIACAFGRKTWIGNIQKVAKSIPFDSSDYIGVVTTNIHSEEERVLKAEYLPQIDVEFEGHVFKGPAGYHAYLSQLYGDDYMQLPPIEKRKSHHGFNLYFRKYN